MGGVRTVDLVVVGLGPGGEALASGAAEAGLAVAAVDKHLVGGECPYYGCIPSKMMLRAADALAETGRAASLAAEVSVVRSWGPVAARVRDATSGWDDQAAVERLESAGVTVLHGTGRLDGARRVVVESAHGGPPVAFEARRGVVMNPGTSPAAPPVAGLAETPYWTNRDAVQATRLPTSLIVMGGGPLGCEFAQVFSRFGVPVTLVQHGERLLPGDEPEASRVLLDVFVADGMRVMTNAEPIDVSHGDGEFTVTLDGGEELVAERLLVAAGREVNLAGIGLETVGLDADHAEVDDRMRLQDGLWMIGDATGHGAFTHISMYQSQDRLRATGRWLAAPSHRRRQRRHGADPERHDTRETGHRHGAVRVGLRDVDEFDSHENILP